MISETSNQLLMAQARESLRGKWGTLIGAFLLYTLIIGVVGAIPYASGLTSIFFDPLLALGFTAMVLAVSRNKKPLLETLFCGFSNRYWTIIGANFLVILFVYLWMLLLIIPGIIAAYSYSLVFYLIIDNPNMKASESLKESKRLMQGNKGKRFYLDCRFIGWGLLCILTFGIGFLWLIPYVAVSQAKFYKDVVGYADPASESDELNIGAPPALPN